MHIVIRLALYCTTAAIAWHTQLFAIPHYGPQQVEIMITSDDEREDAESSQLNTPTLLFKHFSGNKHANVALNFSGTGSFGHGQLLAFSPDGPLNANQLKLLLENVDALKFSPMPVATTLYSYNFQYPQDSLDLTRIMWQENKRRKSLPDLSLETAHMACIQESPRLCLLSVTHNAPKLHRIPKDIGAWESLTYFISSVTTTQQHAQLFSIMRSTGGLSRVISALMEHAQSQPDQFRIISRLPRSPLFTSSPNLIIQKLQDAQISAMLPSLSWLLNKSSWDNLLNSELPVIACNVVDQNEKPLLPNFQLLEYRGIRIAVVGVVSPSFNAQIDPLLQKNITIKDPLNEVRRAIDMAVASLKPHAVILLADVSSKTLKRIMLQIPHITVITSDPDTPSIRRFVPPESEEIFFHNSPEKERPAMSRTRFLTRLFHREVGYLTFTFDYLRNAKPNLYSIRFQSIPLREELNQDPDLLSARMSLFLEGSENSEHLLLPSLESLGKEYPELEGELRKDSLLYPSVSEEIKQNYPLRFTDNSFTQLVVNVLRQAFRSDMAIIRRFHRPAADLAGNLSDSVVQRWLDGLLGRVVKIKLLGSNVLLLLQQLPQTNYLTSGVDDTRTKIWGKLIDTRAYYQIALSDRLLANPKVSAIVAGAQQVNTFTQTKPGTYEPSPAGTQVVMKEAALNALESWAQRIPGGPTNEKFRFWFSKQLQTQGNTIRNGWRVELRDLSIKGADYQAINNEDFSQTSENRANAASSYNLHTKGEIRVLWESEKWLLNNSGRFEAAINAIKDDQQGSGTQPTLDDLVMSSELQYKFTPTVASYLKAEFDSEFNLPNLFKDTADDPLQKIASASLGATWNPLWKFQDFRFGLKVQEDIEQQQGLEFGATAGIEIIPIPIGPFNISGNASLDYFFPTDQDTIEDLGLKGKVLIQLAIPLIDNFSLVVTSDSFIAKGKAENSDKWALSHRLEIGLSYYAIIRAQ